MAVMTVKGLDELEKKLSKLGEKSIEIGKKVVRAGANPVADEIRKNLIENIKDPAYAGKGDGGLWGVKKNYGKSTGDLLDALGISPADVDKNGVINVKVGFSGYDRKGVPNVLKARAMESGTSRLRKRPFVRPAVNKTRQKSKDAMAEKFDELVKIYAL